MNRVIHWTCADESKLLAAVIQQVLADFQYLLGNNHRHPVEQLLPDSLELGLAAWHISNPTLIPASCLTIQDCRRRYPRAVQLAFAPSVGIEDRGRLVEAGAHLVPTQINQIPLQLSQIAAKLLVATECPNPLIGGIFKRLPWAG
jgi:hypothetical protein